MTITPGTKLGAYEILAPIGKGGMGEVWRARDTRLDREVAIKVLPADFANDADRLKRFEQEARATSALNHPNILTVYDIGTHDGAPWAHDIGVPGKVTAQLMGHANVYTTLNTYTQVMDASLRVAADRIGEELFGIVQSEGEVRLLTH